MQYCASSAMLCLQCNASSAEQCSAHSMWCLLVGTDSEVLCLHSMLMPCCFVLPVQCYTCSAMLAVQSNAVLMACDAVLAVLCLQCSAMFMTCIAVRAVLLPCSAMLAVQCYASNAVQCYAYAMQCHECLWPSFWCASLLHAAIFIVILIIYLFIFGRLRLELPLSYLWFKLCKVFCSEVLRSINVSIEISSSEVIQHCLPDEVMLQGLPTWWGVSCNIVLLNNSVTTEKGCRRDCLPEETLF